MTTAARKPTPRLHLIGILLLAALLGFSAPPALAAKKAAEKPAFASLATFTVNLIDGNILHTKVSLQLSSEKDGEEVKGYLPALNDVANRILSQQNKAGLSGAERNKLRAQLLEAMNKRLEKLGSDIELDDVLFESLITQ